LVVAEYVSKERKGKSLVANAAVAVQIHADPGLDGAEHLVSDAALTVLLLVRGEGRSLATHGLLHPMRLTTDAAIMVEVVARAFLGGVHDGLLDEVRHGCDGVF
jgi:hypothetical protein